MLKSEIFYRAFLMTKKPLTKNSKATDHPWDDHETLSARHHMVQEQIAGRGIRDPRVLEAMRKIPRHLFVPEDEKHEAYSDGPVLLGFGQTMSQPYIVALMTEALALQGHEKVLEIGTGSGYQAAILSLLVPTVYSVERIGELARRARNTLAELGITNVRVVYGNGTLGLPEEAPFNAVIVTAAAREIPRPLIEQLAEGGRIVLPVGEQGTQTLVKITKKGQRLEEESLGFCAFVPLIGRAGWEDNNR